MRNKRFPKYPDDTDYTTNSPSYYDDLARKQKLIQLLAEKIWEYENTLNETLEQIEQRLTDYILENDLLMTERLENWDQRIDEMPEEMRSLFVTWLNDGTLEQIINHDVLGNKADKSFVDDEIERLDQKDENLTTQLAHTMYTVRVGDSTEQIQHGIDMSRYVVFEKGVYNVNELFLHDNLIIDFQGSTLKLIGGQLPMKSVLYSKSNKNITLLNGTIDGNREENGHNSGSQDGGNHGLALIGADNIYIENMKFNNCGSDGMYVGETEVVPRVGSRNVFAFNCIFDNNMRQGVSVTNVVNIKFHDCEFTNTNGKEPEAGIDFEPNNSLANVDNVEMVNCRLENNNGRGIVAHLSSREYHNWKFENVIVKNNVEEDVRFTSGVSENKINGITMENCDLAGVSFYEFCEYKDVVISSSKIDILYCDVSHEISIIDSDLRYSVINNYNDVDSKKIMFRSCRFDGLGTTRYGVEFFFRDNIISNIRSTFFIDCIFTGYTLSVAQRINNASVISCVFFDNPCERSILDTLNSVNIFNNLFYGNSITPARIPITSLHIICIGNISDVAFPTGNETSTIHSNTTILS